MIQKKYILTFILVVVLGLTTFFASICRVELPAAKEKMVEEKRAVFFSYIEIEKYFQGLNEKDTKKKIDEILTFLESHHFNMILLQVRSFSDAIYPSKIYPMSKTLVKEEGEEYPFDFLAYFIQKSHQQGIEVHAWINPYRIRSNTDISSISPKNPAYPLV